MVGLSIGAIGVVFGDIGTSPLYALQAIFGPLGQHLEINKQNVFGIISLVVWSVMLVVSIKFLMFIMRADNQGEGGIIALVALIKNNKLAVKFSSFFILMGLIGVALFYGDSVITPAISVLSAVEGLHVVAPSFSSFILPATLIILTLLFGIQRYGTHIIGRLFGPVMLVWFVVIGLGGLWQIVLNPNSLMALSPASAVEFATARPFVAFLSMGAVVLAITGVEALYADMGHFGRRPISLSWFLVVFPALVLCYVGQGALILGDPTAISNPLVLLFPGVFRIPIVLLATIATLIASQAVISGAFSLTRQAVHLNFLPKMVIRHTSTRQTGQVYLPFVNLVIYIFVVLLVLIFGSSQKLANAYGMAVSATLAIDTILFLAVARYIWKKSLGYVASAIIVFLIIDIIFVAANVPKLLRGGWFSISIAIAILVLIRTWLKGQKIVTKERKRLEGPLQSFIDDIHTHKPPVTRVSGDAVYIGHHADLAPLALRATVEQLHELHKKVVIVSVEVTNDAHVPEEDRATFSSLKYENDGISHLILTYGFHDYINVPKTLKSLRSTHAELDINPDTASYFVSLGKVVLTKRHNMSRWRKSLYRLMVRNATSSSDYYRLPVDRTIEMSSLINL